MFDRLLVLLETIMKLISIHQNLFAFFCITVNISDSTIVYVIAWVFIVECHGNGRMDAIY